MTGGGDTDEFEEIPTELDLGADEDDDTPELRLNRNDAIPTAGAADIGGRAGGDDDR
ncbi:hypothetical protein WPS_00940 [Vulcanimicrobium alpinum]|uniref:Uncharacterized protein n=1 Tax=Vulcanimicrobium alpinum TaxID=3016050 RepID=A0AAN1XRW3_UNVUL|nr:hypothetical protein [Vulcanimicrobium alpinum]BDE04818.1 hypothetical protein WPS_00940 [Vulcanimicrobium alpinum]